MEKEDAPGAVLCYGILGVDHIIQVAECADCGGDARITLEAECIGGGATNTAVTLSGLGAPAKLMGCALGEDRRGDLFLRAIRRYMLDAGGLDVVQGVRTFHTVIISEGNGTRRVLEHAPDLRCRPLRKEDIDGISLLSVDASLGRNAVAAARMAKEAGVSVFASALSEHHPLGEYCDVVINTSAFIRRRRMGSHSEVAVGLLKAGAASVVITRGHKGCTVYREDGSSFKHPAFHVSVRDTTGACDAFRAGLIFGYLRGWTLTQSVRFASGTAALTCRNTGGCGHIRNEAQVFRLIGSA